MRPAGGRRANPTDVTALPGRPSEPPANSPSPPIHPTPVNRLPPPATALAPRHRSRPRSAPLPAAFARATSDPALGRRRTLSFLLALLIETLLLLALLTLNFIAPPTTKPDGSLSSFDVAPDSPDQSPTKARKAAAAKPTPVKQPPKIPPKQLPDRPLPMLIVTKDVFAASDIAKLGTKATAPDAGEEQAANSPGDSPRVGTGPHGEPLYRAEWYREPTDQQLSAYLPPNKPNIGSGIVACRTIDRYHVADCVELTNNPPGSHLASAVRQAAWQFLVRPPRKGGKELVGEWVRIQIFYGVGDPDKSGE